MSPLSPQSSDQRAMERHAGSGGRLAEKPLSGQDVLLGRAAGAGTAQPPYPGERSSGKATASLACGIVGLFIVPVVLPILAIVFGSLALSEMRKDPEIDGSWKAISGVTLGIAGLVLVAVYVLSVFAGL